MTGHWHIRSDRSMGSETYYDRQGDQQRTDRPTNRKTDIRVQREVSLQIWEVTLKTVFLILLVSLARYFLDLKRELKYKFILGFSLDFEFINDWINDPEYIVIVNASFRTAYVRECTNCIPSKIVFLLVFLSGVHWRC